MHYELCMGQVGSTIASSIESSVGQVPSVAVASVGHNNQFVGIYTLPQGMLGPRLVTPMMTPMMTLAPGTGPPVSRGAPVPPGATFPFFGHN